MGLTHDGRDIIESIEAAIAASKCEDEREVHRSQLKQRWPNVMTGGYEPAWDKRDLVYLYEDINFKGSTKGVKMKDSDFTAEYNRFQRLSPHQTKLVQSTFEHSTHNNQVVRPDTEELIKETLFWRTGIRKVKKADVSEHEEATKLMNHFAVCNWCMPLLLGSQHNNRFKRNTKVYVLSGEHKGRHGTVVGHDSGFDLKARDTYAGKSPRLRVILMCPLTKTFEVKGIHQDVVKLVDLHNQLEFGLPALCPSDSLGDKKKIGGPKMH